MKNRIDAKLRKLEEKAGLKKNRLKIFVRGFGEPEPVTDEEDFNIIVQRFADPSANYDPGPIVIGKPKNHLDEQIEAVVTELKAQGFDDKDINEMMVEKPRPIDKGLYPSKDRKDRWM